MHGKLKLLLAVAVLAIFLPLCAYAGMGGSKMLKTGSAAPDFKFTDLTGKSSSLSSFSAGKPVLLIFIQTACGSCQREMQFLKGAVADAGANVLVIFIDVKEMDFKKYVKENGLEFTFAWDSEFSVAESFGVSFAPASFLIDKDLQVAKVYRGWSRAGEEVVGDVKALTGK